LEAVKWHFLVNKIQVIGFSKALQAIFSGVTLGVFTPNRIGEYGGRIFYIRRRNRIKAIVATLVGSYSQILVTVVSGFVSALFFLKRNYIDNLLAFIGLGMLATLLLTLGFLLYFNLHLLIFWFEKVKFFRRLKSYVSIIREYRRTELIRIFFISFSRYLVFTTQYLILLKIFGVSTSLFTSAILVSLIFFTQSVIPSFAIAELLTRGSIALFYFDFYSDNDLGVIAASTSLWFINLILPAVLGYVFIFRYNFFEKRSVPQGNKS
jgi:hypothetical protein